MSSKRFSRLCHVWSIGNLVDAALATHPITPTETAPDRRKRFRVIEGGRK
jgi:hypothetical protein